MAQNNTTSTLASLLSQPSGGFLDDINLPIALAGAAMLQRGDIGEGIQAFLQGLPYQERREEQERQGQLRAAVQQAIQSGEQDQILAALSAMSPETAARYQLEQMSGHDPASGAGLIQHFIDQGMSVPEAHRQARMTVRLPRQGGGGGGGGGGVGFNSVSQRFLEGERRRLIDEVQDALSGVNLESVTEYAVRNGIRGEGEGGQLTREQLQEIQRDLIRRSTRPHVLRGWNMGFDVTNQFEELQGIDYGNVQQEFGEEPSLPPDPGDAPQLSIPENEVDAAVSPTEDGAVRQSIRDEVNYLREEAQRQGIPITDQQIISILAQEYGEALIQDVMGGM